MKRYLIIPIILTLTACGGGSPISATEETSNQIITQTISTPSVPTDKRKGINPPNCTNPLACI